MGNTAKQLENKVLIQDINKQTSKNFKLWRMFAFPASFVGFIITALLCISLVGIVPGIGIGIGSGFLFLSALGQQKHNCIHCNKENKILHRTENFTCKKCGNKTIINWT